jgi:hypothetical protein
MPFTKVEDREKALKGIIEAVGDMCFLEYKPLKEGWDKLPRWTTAHEQYQRLFNLTDERAAKELAWWVHFVLNVIPYEVKKREENGDI